MIERPPITRDGAQHAAHDELSKAIYHQQTDPLPVRATKWIGHQIDRLLGTTFTHSPTGSFGAFALVILIVVVVAVIIWRVGPPRRAAAIGSVLASGKTTTAADHRRLAQEAAGRGDWNVAVLERMRAVARELEERGTLSARPGRTATELAAEASPLLAAGGDRLTVAAQRFNDVVYGGATATRADDDVIQAADEAVRQSSRRTVLAR
jgi:hypothetical protein